MSTSAPAGKTIAEVGQRLAGDMLADDPLATYDNALSADSDTQTLLLAMLGRDNRP
jgi:hypothetical protein